MTTPSAGPPATGGTAPLSGGQSTVSNVHTPALEIKSRRRLPKPNQTVGEARLSELTDDLDFGAEFRGGLSIGQGLGQDY